MNVKEVYGCQLNLQINYKIFHMSHFYYAAGESSTYPFSGSQSLRIFFYFTGIRLYYTVIPLAAWMVSGWLLVAVCPFYLYLAEEYDNAVYVEPHLEDMYRGYKFDRNNMKLEEEEAMLEATPRKTLTLTDMNKSKSAQQL